MATSSLEEADTCDPSLNNSIMLSKSSNELCACSSPGRRWLSLSAVFVCVF